MSDFETFQRSPLQQARLQTAAWALAVQGAKLEIRNKRSDLLECTQDTIDLRKRLEKIAQNGNRSAQVSVCMNNLKAEISRYSQILQHQTECLLLLEAKTTLFERQLEEFVARLTRSDEQQRRSGSLSKRVAPQSTSGIATSKRI